MSASGLNQLDAQLEYLRLTHMQDHCQALADKQAPMHPHPHSLMSQVKHDAQGDQSHAYRREVGIRDGSCRREGGT